LPIGGDQTISQPYIVALMSELLELEGGERVLEVGTGSGYQAAVLSRLASDVVSIERLPDLAAEARSRLAALGYDNVRVIVADGAAGWPAEAPYGGILVAAAPAEVPPAMVEQLAPGARLVIPVGVWDQDLLRVTRSAAGDAETERIIAVRFVPLVGGG
jgi:protein-L-isoaspartate(D-aspartate) O-methyltransferase